jgi:hypothetical protein
MSPVHDAEVFADAAATELIEAADRKRRALRKPARSARPAADAGSALSDADEPAEQVAEDADEQDSDAGPDGEERPARRKPRRRVMRPAKAGVFPALEADDQVGEGDGPGTVTRGIHAGLSGAAWAQDRARSLGLWGMAAAAVVLVLVGVSFYAGSQAPEPMPVSGLRVTYLPGPQLPQREVQAWIRSFPFADKLKDGTPWVLDKLAEHLRRQPVVAEVRQVTVVHEPNGPDAQHLQRTLELVIGLRRPVMPVVLASGERAWVDAEGWLLPGTLPGPLVRRPVLRAIEWGGVDGVRAALALWKQLEPQVEQGLITDIHLYDWLDPKGLQRGIVLYTRQGSRLIWGNPGEARYGVRPEDKVRDLVHTLRCQGDLNRVAAINVRFRQPFFVLRDAQR